MQWVDKTDGARIVVGKGSGGGTRHLLKPPPVNHSHGWFYLARGDARIPSESRSPQGLLSLSANIEPNSRVPDIAGRTVDALLADQSRFSLAGFVSQVWALIHAVASFSEVKFPQ
jgi:hypothetical protein